MARSIIKKTACDKCHEEIPQNRPPLCGVMWDPQNVEIPIKSVAENAQHGDFCPKCMIGKLEHYVKKLRKLHNIKEGEETFDDTPIDDK